MSSKFTAASNPSRSINNIGSLPDEYLKNKYAVTKDYYYDPNCVENFQKEAIKYNGCETPIFEEEFIRTSTTHRQDRLSMMEHGSRYSHTPYHPGLFLGDLTKDERGTFNEPLAHKVTEQNAFRQKRYIFMQDDNTHNIIEGVVNEKDMMNRVKQGLNKTASIYKGVFDESNDGVHYAANSNPGNNKSNLEVTIKEDQKFYESQGETIMYPAVIASKTGIHFLIVGNESGVFSLGK